MSTQKIQSASQIIKARSAGRGVPSARLAAKVKANAALTSKVKAYLLKANAYLDAKVADFQRGASSKLATMAKKDAKAAFALVAKTANAVSANVATVTPQIVAAYKAAVAANAAAESEAAMTLADALATTASKASLVAAFSEVCAADDVEEVLEVDDAGYVVEDELNDAGEELVSTIATKLPRSGGEKPMASLPEAQSSKNDKYKGNKKADADTLLDKKDEEQGTGAPAEAAKAKKAADDLIKKELNSEEVIASAEDELDEAIDLSTLGADEIDEEVIEDVVEEVTSQANTAVASLQARREARRKVAAKQDDGMLSLSKIISNGILGSR